MGSYARMLYFDGKHSLWNFGFESYVPAVAIWKGHGTFRMCRFCWKKLITGNRLFRLSSMALLSAIAVFWLRVQWSIVSIPWYFDLLVMKDCITMKLWTPNYTFLSNNHFIHCKDVSLFYLSSLRHPLIVLIKNWTVNRKTGEDRQDFWREKGTWKKILSWGFTSKMQRKSDIW